MELTFTSDDLARICCHQPALAAWAGGDAGAIEQLLAELCSVDKLGEVEEFPHVRLLAAARVRVGVEGADEAGVLLQPAVANSRAFRDAEAATVVAVAARDEDFNPEGATWPRAFAMSRITQ